MSAITSSALTVSEATGPMLLRRPTMADRPRRRLGAERALLEDLGRAVPVLKAHLVRPRRPARPVVEVDEEARIDRHPALRMAVDLQQPGAELGVELVVPGRVEGVRHV